MCDEISIKIKNWLDKAFKNKNLFNAKIEVEGQTNKGDGFSGDMHFVKVSGTDENGLEKILHLAVKSSKDNAALRQKVPIQEAYLKEIFIYEDVKPTYLNFLRSKGIDENLEFLSKCFATYVDDNTEVLFFENLRPKGFKLWNKSVPVTSNHVRLALEAYGKWHALSMALKRQKPEIFQKLVENNINMFTHIFNHMNMGDALQKEFEKAKDIVIDADEKNILKNLQYSCDDIKYTFSEMYFEDPEYSVILHGDCWNNNFLYNFSDDEKDPSEIRILDWQCSGLGSPAIDLGHFIYCCADTGKHQDIKELLHIYYDTFSKYLTLLGCDPEEIFPFEKLLEHWKRFSRLGLLLSCWVINICLMKQDDLPDFAENAEKSDDLLADFTSDATKDENYIKRVTNNLLHYCKNSM